MWSFCFTRLKTFQIMVFNYPLSAPPFGERVFMKIFKDQKVFPEYEKLYNYLTENGVVTEEINQAYHQVHDKNAPTEKDREDFYRAVVKKADADMRDRLEGKTDQPAFTFDPWQPDPVENFVGRAEILKNIKKQLDDKGLAIICGMGGMGKSQTALQYAKNNEKYYRGGMQQVSFEESLSTTLLSIKKDDDSQKTPAQQMQDLMQNLRQLAAPSLLIIDNVDTELAGDDMAILKELIQMDLHVLITSRNTKLYDPAYMIPFSGMDETDQMELFRNNYRPDFSKNPEDFQLPENWFAECPTPVMTANLNWCCFDWWGGVDFADWNMAWQVDANNVIHITANQKQFLNFDRATGIATYGDGTTRQYQTY